MIGQKINKTTLALCIAMGASFASSVTMADVLNKSADALVAPSDMSLDPYAGGDFYDKPIAGLPQVIDQIWTGYVNSANAEVITYNFPKGDHLTGLYNNRHYGFTSGDGLNGFSEMQKESARKSIQLWDDLIAPRFIERGNQGADIQLVNSDDPGQAYAYYPEYGFTNAKGFKFFGDVFVASPDGNWTNNWLIFGGYGVTTVIHEVGHTLGLSHPGAYNGSGAIDYVTQAQYAQDSTQYSIMSYWEEGNTSNQPFKWGIVDWSTGYYNYPQTPLVHDILAAHEAYGANPNTRNDDTVYGWNSTAANEVYDFSQNLFPWLSIYDAGGNDTIDMSGANASVFIDLEPGAFSSGASEVPSEDVVNTKLQVMGQMIGFNLGEVTEGWSAEKNALATASHEPILTFETMLDGYEVRGLGVTSHDNLSIAYGTIIENAIGSSKRDYLKGNHVANVLTGNGGDDVLNGYEGADTYVGGEGADTFVFSEIETGDMIADFVSGEDMIVISITDVSFSFIDGAEFSQVAGELRYADGMLMGDVDGDGAADLIIDLNDAALAGSDLTL